MTLPADVARCAGAGLPECQTCRRLTDPVREPASWWTGPWELEGVPCEMRIPNEQPKKLGESHRHVGAVGSRPAHYPGAN
jgi:hypothetical protein